jgi:hypothetical protein
MIFDVYNKEQEKSGSEDDNEHEEHSQRNENHTEGIAWDKDIEKSLYPQGELCVLVRRGQVACMVGVNLRESSVENVCIIVSSIATTIANAF